MQGAVARGLGVGKRTARGPASACLLALVLAGCAADAPDRSLPFRMPAAYSTGAKPDSSTSRWWARFRSAEMDRLVETADSQNFDIAAAAARLSQADAQARITGAALFPSIGFAGDAQESQSSGTMGGRSIGQTSFRRSFGTVLTASYIVDIWGKLRDSARAAELQADATGYARDVVRVSTQAAVATAYLQYVAANERLRVGQENLRNGERILTVIRERLAAGTGSALDVAQQEALVAGQRASLPLLRETASNARITLALLLGRPPQGFALRGAGLFSIALPRVAPGLPSSLIIRRPDIRQAEFALAAAEADVQAARKALLPSLDLTGQGGFQSARLINLLRPESAVYTVAAGLTQSVFDGNKLRSQVDLAAARKQELLEAYRKSIVSGLSDVELALTAIREGAARESARNDALAKARVAFRLAEERLRQGTIDLVTVLNTQQTLFQTQDQLIQDRLTRLQALVNLFQVLGGDWEARELERLASRRVPVETPPQEGMP